MDLKITRRNHSVLYDPSRIRDEVAEIKFSEISSKTLHIVMPILAAVIFLLGFLFLVKRSLSKLKKLSEKVESLPRTNRDAEYINRAHEREEL